MTSPGTKYFPMIDISTSGYENLKYTLTVKDRNFYIMLLRLCANTVNTMLIFSNFPSL